MWKNYSADYIKYNRAGSVTIRAAALISAMFLSYLCSLFYNFRLDNIRQTEAEDGDWHGRITGEISGDDLTAVRNYANVERAVQNEELSDERKTVVDLYFSDKRTICRDMNALLAILGLPEEAADYNYQLLSLYFVRIPGDDMPRLLMPAYLAVVVVMCLSLIMVFHNSFAVSMNARIHQFGIFSSIGATPGQILICLMQEAFMLSMMPVLAGISLGFVLSFGTVLAMSAFAENFVGGRQMDFGWHPILPGLIFLLSFLTVLVSAWIPAWKLSRTTPLEAIRGADGPGLKKRKRGAYAWFLLFGMEGELAGCALRAQKKVLRTTTLSLTLAFSGFMVMECFFTLSGISTEHTYFEAYQDTWDIMSTIKDTKIEDFARIGEIQKLQGVQSGTVYQKAEAVCMIPEEDISAELLALGGPEALAGPSLSAVDGFFLIKSPIIILDDKSFAEYCKQVDITPNLNGTIVLNRIWNSLDSNFRYREYLPYIKEDTKTVILRSAAADRQADSGYITELPVLCHAQEVPVLREEYEEDTLVQFMSLSLWKEIEGQMGGTEDDTYIRVLANERRTPEALDALEEEIVRIIGSEYETESENRIREKLDNDNMIKGYKLILGAFCVLLAVIGIAHVFSCTLGFLNQRKREFARYMSVGLTPEGMRKIFCLEAVGIVGRPMLAALALAGISVAFMIRMSYLDPAEFLREAPAGPILLFLLAVFGSVGLAYYLGGKKMEKAGLAEALRDDTML